MENEVLSQHFLTKSNHTRHLIIVKHFRIDDDIMLNRSNPCKNLRPRNPVINSRRPPEFQFGKER